MKELLAQLLNNKVVRVELSYNGQGDEGFVEEATCYGADDREIEVPDSLDTALEDWAYDILNSQYAGWEINEGSYGLITINVADRKATIEHNENVVIADSSTVTLDLR